MEPTLEELVEAAARRDADAFARLISRFQRPALAVAFALTGKPDSAGEIVQEAFLRAWERLAASNSPDVRRLADGNRPQPRGRLAPAATDAGRQRGSRSGRSALHFAARCPGSRGTFPASSPGAGSTGSDFAGGRDVALFDARTSRQIGQLLNVVRRRPSDALLEPRQFLRSDWRHNWNISHESLRPSKRI